MFKHLLAAAIVLTCQTPLALADPDWESMSYLPHSTFQGVDSDGSPAYAVTGPFRMVGVVLNDTEDWLDPTPAYDPQVNLWQMGGEAEIFVQAMHRSTQSALGVELYEPADFGGTACWMGQNYGNHYKHQDPLFSYTDAEWTAELGRLGLHGGDDVTQPIRAGDLVEIRARIGLHYKGKFNVNENHDNGLGSDFEIVRLQAGFGLPDAVELTLSDLKDAENVAIFDSTRLSGPERYQATRVTLTGLKLDGPLTLTQDSDPIVTDGQGRTFTLHLGLDAGFDGSTLSLGEDETLAATGVLDQLAPMSGPFTSGYRLLVMDAGDLQVVPEPASMALLTAGAVWLGRRRRR
jgi:hypothetical protein